LTAYDRAFVIGSLLLWIYHYRMRQPEREILKHFMIIEEAHHLFLKTGKEEDIADIIMREIRELGESVIIIDQHPSKMSVSALGNLSTKFALSLSLNQDVSALANAMLLENDQKKYLSMLGLGQCICRSDRLSQPLLLSIPDFPLKKGLVRDEDLKTHMDGYLKDLRPKEGPLPKKSNIRGIQKQETLSPLGRILLEKAEVNLEEFSLKESQLKKLKKVYLVACGTSWHSALIGKYMIEDMARIPCEVDIASDFRYRKPLIPRDSLMIVITQSGETADTLAAQREAKKLGVKVLSEDDWLKLIS